MSSFIIIGSLGVLESCRESRKWAIMWILYSNTTKWLLLINSSNLFFLLNSLNVCYYVWSDIGRGDFWFLAYTVLFGSLFESYNHPSSTLLLAQRTNWIFGIATTDSAVYSQLSAQSQIQSSSFLLEDSEWLWETSSVLSYESLVPAKGLAIYREISSL